MLLILFMITTLLIEVNGMPLVYLDNTTLNIDCHRIMFVTDYVIHDNVVYYSQCLNSRCEILAWNSDFRLNFEDYSNFEIYRLELDQDRLIIRSNYLVFVYDLKYKTLINCYEDEINED